MSTNIEHQEQKSMKQTKRQEKRQQKKEKIKQEKINRKIKMEAIRDEKAANGILTRREHHSLHNDTEYHHPKFKKKVKQWNLNKRYATGLKGRQIPVWKRSLFLNYYRKEELLKEQAKKSAKEQSISLSKINNNKFEIGSNKEPNGIQTGSNKEPNKIQ